MPRHHSHSRKFLEIWHISFQDVMKTWLFLAAYLRSCDGKPFMLVMIVTLWRSVLMTCTTCTVFPLWSDADVFEHKFTISYGIFLISLLPFLGIFPSWSRYHTEQYRSPLPSTLMEHSLNLTTQVKTFMISWYWENLQEISTRQFLLLSFCKHPRVLQNAFYPPTLLPHKLLWIFSGPCI